MGIEPTGPVLRQIPLDLKADHQRMTVEIKRPSRTFVRAGKDGDKVNNVRVGGHAVHVMEGTLTL